MSEKVPFIPGDRVEVPDIPFKERVALRADKTAVIVMDMQNDFVKPGGTLVVPAAIELSETPAKVPNPGDKRVWRVYDRRGQATADLLALREEEPGEAERLVLRHPTQEGTYRVLEQEEVSQLEPLLVDVYREGARVGEVPSIEAMRTRRQADLARLDPGVRRIVNPHVYHVSLSERLWEMKQALIASIGGR